MKTKFGMLASAACAAGLLSGASSAQAQVAQSCPVPIQIDQVSTTDNIQVLVAACAERTSTMGLWLGETRKHFWVEAMTQPTDYVEWTIFVPTAADYQATALIGSQFTNKGFKLEVIVDGIVTNTFNGIAPSGKGLYVSRKNIGTLSLSAGTNKIRITRTSNITGAADDTLRIKSLELLRSSDVAAYNARVAAKRADVSWFSDMKYGMMLQYGTWGVPGNVGFPKSTDQVTNDFDVPSFVRMVKASGAQYLIWSYSWWGFKGQAALQSPDQLVAAVGGPTTGLTSQRNLIGEVAAALKAEGIRFIIYYHPGAEETTAWWQYQDFPSTFLLQGIGDRSRFLNNWKTVVAELGNKLGTNLDGIMFDDGLTYYPAKFEELQDAARAGNPNRFVSFNSWKVAKYTDFQDVFFGEGYIAGEGGFADPPLNGNGKFTVDSQVGLAAQGMTSLDCDWGVFWRGGAGKKVICPSRTIQTILPKITKAVTYKAPTSLALMMYEDGTVAPQDLQTFNNLRQAILLTTDPVVPTNTITLNNDDPALASGYVGTWERATGRNVDYGQDIHYTRTNNDSFSYTFNGTGLDIIGPQGNTMGTFDAYVDNVLIGSFNSNRTASYNAQQVIYSARHLSSGSHTVKLVKTGGSFMQIDAVRVIPEIQTLNNKDPMIQYGPGWTHTTAARKAGDYQDDVSHAAANGSSFTIPFTGSAIELIGPMTNANGTADVYLDGVKVSTIQGKPSTATGYYPQQHLLTLGPLAPGNHTVTVTKTSGGYFQLDALKITP